MQNRYASLFSFHEKETNGGFVDDAMVNLCESFFRNTFGIPLLPQRNFTLNLEALKLRNFSVMNYVSRTTDQRRKR